MSFTKSKNVIEEDDTVLLHIGFDNFVPVQLKRGRVHQTRYGAIKHERLIGAPYGVKLECSKGWVYPLQPNPELWTLALPHRTQILYSPDISMIILQLDLKPGSVVIEAGTGSGSLSHALIRSIMPTGRLHTFEFHAERCAAAHKEFQDHGLADYVTAKHRDVCAQGFELITEADAVFLDLPAPWECIGHAKQALKPGGRICSFSPCMEQVQRTCQTLTEHGFTDLTTLECLARYFSVQKIHLPFVDFGDQAEPETHQKVTLTQTSEDNSSQECTARVSESGEGARGREDELMEDVGEMNTASKSGKKASRQRAKTEVKGRKFRTGAPPEVMQGHTGFLTFASLY